MVCTFPLLPPPSCEHCVLGKQTCSTMPKVREGAWAGGASRPCVGCRESLCYVLNIIDDFSSYYWLIPLSAKSEAFAALQAWEIVCEVETGLRVGILHFDNGELKYNDLKDWPLSCGTQHQFTAPHMYVCSEQLHRTCPLYTDGESPCHAILHLSST